MKNQFQASGLWQSINQSVAGDVSQIDVHSFRSPGSFNNRLASWDPEGNSFRYYKTILFNMALALSERELCILDKVTGRETGNPVTVKTRGRSVCLDYLLAVNEYAFLERMLPGGVAGSILEIGGGFGRTCHTLLSNSERIDRYTIIDLGVCLDLAQRYLRVVLPETLFSKLTFVHIDDILTLQQSHFDLALNIDSMAEMNADVVGHYLAFIDAHCDRFYCKNPVGKYAPASVGIQIKNVAEFELAMRMGVLTEIVDIFDDVAISEASKRFLRAYTPSTGWTLLADESSRPWQYYHQALYSNGRTTP